MTKNRELLDNRLNEIVRLRALLQKRNDALKIIAYHGLTAPDMVRIAKAELTLPRIEGFGGNYG